MSIARFGRNPVAEMLNWLENDALPVRGLGLTPFVRVEDFMDGDVYVLRAEMPGIDPEKDVTISIDGSVLTISGERREETKEKEHQEFHYGSFTRSLRLPTGAKADEITADYSDGVLELRVPIDQQKSTARTIPVQRKEG